MKEILIRVRIFLNLAAIITKIGGENLQEMGAHLRGMEENLGEEKVKNFFDRSGRRKFSFQNCLLDPPL